MDQTNQLPGGHPRPHDQLPGLSAEERAQPAGGAFGLELFEGALFEGALFEGALFDALDGRLTGSAGSASGAGSPGDTGLGGAGSSALPT
jgi:hypothetical protein